MSSGVSNILSASSALNSYDAVFFNASDALNFSEVNSGSTGFLLTTTQVFRDPSAWYHIVIAYDSAQATPSNRVKLYVNGNQITAFSSASYPSLNNGSYFGWINSTSNTIGRFAGSAIEYFDGHIAEINFVTGIALTPSSFGEINSLTGVWSPKKYSGAYGTNSYYLKFNDNSSVAATGIGKDFSGKGNNWTPNNISITTGATYDSMLDIPTNNYCTLNPLDSASASIVQQGNLYLNNTASSYLGCRSSLSLNNGKWYWEVETGNATAGVSSPMFGIGLNSVGLSVQIGVAGAYVFKANDNTFTSNGTLLWDIAGSSPGTILRCAYDSTTGNFWVGNASGWYNSTGALTGDPATGANPVVTVPTSATYFPIFSCYATVIAANFGQRPFQYTVPQGFFAICSANMSTPTVVNGASAMAATAYTGTGNNSVFYNTVYGTSCQPDIVWIKSRIDATDHALYDFIRGTNQDLASNTTNAETNELTGLSAFNFTGFTLGSLAKINTLNSTYIAWQWKANASTVFNTNGTISSSVSSNQSTGVSVLKYFGNSTNSTVGHGLNDIPKFIIVKNKSDSGYSWCVYHSEIGSTSVLFLNTTDSALASGFVWNNTTPTSSVFSIGTAADVNKVSSNFVAYCFSEINGFSKFGKYTGNGSADGQFVYCGFRPRFIIIKCSSATGDWAMIDTTRSPFNVAGITSSANTAAAEAALLSIDILANGFKIRSATLNNTSAATYIFAAWAENSIKYALAR